MVLRLEIDYTYCTPVHGFCMVVLGIDPGSRTTGYAVVSRKSGRFHLVEAGTVCSNPKNDIPTRLHTIYTGLYEIIGRFSPDSAAIEAIFRHKSSESALRLGQARGVALLALAQYKLPITDYNPMTVKKSIGGSGRAGKTEMIRVVTRLLGLKKDLPSDAADAAAIAMTHLIHSAFQARIPKK